MGKERRNTEGEEMKSKKESERAPQQGGDVSVEPPGALGAGGGGSPVIARRI